MIQGQGLEDRRAEGPPTSSLRHQWTHAVVHPTGHLCKRPASRGTSVPVLGYEVESDGFEYLNSQRPPPDLPKNLQFAVTLTYLRLAVRRPLVYDIRSEHILVFRQRLLIQTSSREVLMSINHFRDLSSACHSRTQHHYAQSHKTPIFFRPNCDNVGVLRVRDSA